MTNSYLLLLVDKKKKINDKKVYIYKDGPDKNT